MVKLAPPSDLVMVKSGGINSNAPMSLPVPLAAFMMAGKLNGRATPRWSVASPGVAAWSMAGLPGLSACVWVLPGALSASVARLGSIPVMSAPGQALGDAALVLIKLLVLPVVVTLPLATLTKQSVAPLGVLAAMV